MTTSAFRVEVQQWMDGYVPGYGRGDPYWTRIDAGRTYADTADRAAGLAEEALRAYGEL